MTKNMFSPENIENLRGAIVDVFDIFSEILFKPCNNYEDLKERLEVVDAVKLESIRAKYLDEDYTGYSDGDFTSRESNSVVKILYDFIKLMERCSQSVIWKLGDKCKEVTEMEEKVRLMEGRVKRTEAVLHTQEDNYKKKCSENSELLARISQVQATVEEKNKRIGELEKDKNVHVWESEKKRILKESAEKIERLEKENEELKTARDSLKTRLTSMEDETKKLRMKQRLHEGREPSPDTNSNKTEASDTLSRKNFMQDKDIVYLEKQLYNLQTSTVGVLGGMKTDLGMLTHKFYDDEEGEVDPEFVRLKGRMDKCYMAVADGDIESTKTDLPAHYRYIENSNFKVKRIRRLSSTAVVPNQRVLQSIMNEKKTASVPPTMSGIEEAPTNPEIINPITKRLHPINPLKYFGHMSQTFILDQFEKFKEFDKNGDGSLDLAEMVKVVTQLGFNFTAHQLQEAMEEVDRDHNHTLDFFEYLLIIDNIYKKSGKAEVFRDGMKELQTKNASKSCAIQ